MTTIAWRPGEIAADTLVCTRHTREGELPKVVQRGDAFAAATGCSISSRRFLDWFSAGMSGDSPNLGDDDDHDKSAWGYLLRGDRVVWFRTRGAVSFRARFYAMGSGADFAMGAMVMGATPSEAVAAAMQFDKSTGGAIQTWRA